MCCRPAFLCKSHIPPQSLIRDRTETVFFYIIPCTRFTPSHATLRPIWCTPPPYLFMLRPTYVDHPIQWTRTISEYMNGTKPVQNLIQICPAVFELNHTEKSAHKVISLKLGCKEHITRIIFLNSISKLILVTEECCFFF